MHKFGNKKGTALILTFIVLVGLTGIAFAFLTMVTDEIGSAGAGLWNMQAFYIAEAGLAKGRWALGEGGEAVGWGESDAPFGEGTYTVTTADNGDSTYTITSEGYVPNDTDPLAKRQVIESNIPASSISANYSLTATATASSEQGGNTADKAIDGDINTKWKSSVNNGSWLKLDFGSAITFNRIVYTGATIDSYTIEYSNNDIDYNAVTNPVEAPAGTVNFDSVSARYLRFNVNGNKPSVDELETYNTNAAGLGKGEFSTSW